MVHFPSYVSLPECTSNFQMLDYFGRIWKGFLSFSKHISSWKWDHLRSEFALILAWFIAPFLIISVCQTTFSNFWKQFVYVVSCDLVQLPSITWRIINVSKWLGTGIKATWEKNHLGDLVTNGSWPLTSPGMGWSSKYSPQNSPAHAPEKWWVGKWSLHF